MREMYEFKVGTQGIDDEPTGELLYKEIGKKRWSKMDFYDFENLEWVADRLNELYRRLALEKNNRREK